MHLLAPLITSKTFAVLIGLDAVLIAADIADTNFGSADIPSLIIDQGIQVAIVVLFIVGQWTNRIVFVNKNQTTQLDRIETAVNRIATHGHPQS